MNVHLFCWSLQYNEGKRHRRKYRHLPSQLMAFIGKNNGILAFIGKNNGI
jgi:hypothetical protein